MRETSSLSFCNTPHCEAERAVAVRREHVTTAEVQGVPVRTGRRSRPVAAVVAHVAQLPIAVAAVPRSWEERRTGITFRITVIYWNLKLPGGIVGSYI